MKKTLLAIILLTAITLSLAACGSTDTTTTIPNKYGDFVSELKLTYEGDTWAILETSKGMFAIELFTSLVPATVENFSNLAKSGFYNGLKWHLVVPGVKIQTGDPTGIGTGSANIPAIKLETHPDLKHEAPGMLGMARYENDLDSATSQFYITLDAEPEWDRKYAIFGQVKKGAELLGAIERNDTITALVVLQ